MSGYPGNPQYPPPQNPQYQQQVPGYHSPQQQARPAGYPQQQPPQYGYPQYQQTPPQNVAYAQAHPQYPAPTQQQYPPPPSTQYPPQYPPQQQYPGAHPQYPPPPHTQQPYGAPPTTQGQPGYAQQPPPQQFQQGWFGSFYNQINQNDMSYLQNWFASIDRDRSGTLDVMELATMPFNGKALGIEPAKKLIKAFDKNYSGKIDFYETAALHQFMVQMQNAFYAADKDRSGYLDSTEIHHALQNGGFQLGLGSVQEICKKFDKGQGISLENFLLICAHLATVRSIFEWNDPQRTGKVTYNLDQLCHVTVHLMD